MPPPPPPPPASAQPLRHRPFDPYNSSTTGHQSGGDNRLSTSLSWRHSRSAKLTAQLSAGIVARGGRRVQDTVGAGSLHFGHDGRKENGGWVRGASGLRREMGCRGVKDMMSGVRKVRSEATGKDPPSPVGGHLKMTAGEKGKIFNGLTFYINGCTAPLVSDHRLKYLIVENGGRVAIALGRKSVTHVILGAAAYQLGSDNGAAGNGAGGGLAAGKLHREVQRLRGSVVKYVKVEWVLDSITTGRRLPESRFAPINLASSRQKTVQEMFKRQGVPTHNES